MRARRFAVLIGLLLSVATFVPAREANAQVLVLPRRADKAQVRRFEFDWRFVDVPLPGGTPEGAPPEPGDSGQAPGAPATPTPPGEGPAPEGSTPPGKASPPPATPGAPVAPGASAVSPRPLDPRTLTAAEADEAIRRSLGSDAVHDDAVDAPVSSSVSGTAPKIGDAPNGAKQPGLRLYFYERERDVAEIAIPLIVEAHEYLRKQFEYTPTERFPYILYNTYQEFLETRLFQVQEGILGVTSPIDLTLTLPYFGDHRRFSEVSTHEMAHQFTIQKLRDIARREKSDSAIERMPLWFIEGLAEYYAHQGIDAETEMLARDIVVNPDGERGYALLDFFEDRPGSVLWTYKVGQARCAFLEDAFGPGTIQRIIERAQFLEGGRMFSSADHVMSFPRLLERVTGESKDVLAAHFADWLKKRAYRTYLESKQPPSSLVPLGREFSEDPILGLTSSPDGELLLFRRIDITIGQTQLVLLDRRDRRRLRVVTSDGQPGAESLHPISPRNFSLSSNALVYTAQVDSRDVIYWQAVNHSARPADPKERSRRYGGPPGYGSAGMGRVGAPPRMPTDPPGPDEKQWDVTLSLGDRMTIELGPVIAVESPALSPDGTRVAFIGTDETGFRDVYVVDLREASHQLHRVTNDHWTERQASWGRDGIVYTSDATENGKFNLFAVDLDAGKPPVRLTVEDRDESDPLATSDGRVFFVAYQDARADVHEVVQGKIVRRTDVVTGMSDVSVGPDGGLWGLWLHSGRHQPVRIARTDLMDLATPAQAAYGAPEPMAEYRLAGGDAEHVYSATSPSNWRLGPIFGLLGAGSGFIFGQVYASATDLMRDDVLILNLNIWGNFDLTDGMFLYINQAGKIAWGGGLFQSLNYRLDRTLEALPGGPSFTSYERFFGAMGLARYPFSTFEYLEATVAVGGTRYFLAPGDSLQLQVGGWYDYWASQNQKTYPQIEGALSLGHDTIRYHMLTGPLDGSSVLAQVSVAYQPTRGVTYGEARLDAAKYVAIGGAAKVFARAGVGTSFGGQWARQFYLSSFDTLRGVRYGTTDYLLGSNFYFSTLQLQFPLGALIRVIFLPNIEGVAGLDFGGVGDTSKELWQKRVFDAVLGTNLVFGPLVFRVHFAKPIGTGAHPERLSTPVAPLSSGWVTNLSLSWLGF